MITFKTFLEIIIITIFLISLIAFYVGYKKAKFWHDKVEMDGARFGFIFLLGGLLVFVFILILQSPIIK